MTQTQIRALVRVWQRRLGLGHWTLDVKFVDRYYTAAECEWDDMYDTATLAFNPRKIAERPEDDFWERTIIHELLHLCDRDRREHGKNLQKLLGAEAYQLFEATTEKILEQEIDRLATAFWTLAHEVD